jgi:hypothetical protein
MYKVLFEKTPGMVKGYSRVKWTITHEHAANKNMFKIRSVSRAFEAFLTAMSESEIADDNHFYENNGYTIERVKNV